MTYHGVRVTISVGATTSGSMRTVLLLALALLAPACNGSDRRPTAAPPARGPAMQGPAPTTGAEPPAAERASPAERPVGAPAEPPYDLGADRARRAVAARTELGERVVTAVVADTFVLVGPPGWQGASFDRSVALVRSAMAAFLNGRFAKKPERAISVYLFGTGASYERYCKQQYDAPCIAHYGFYSPSDRYMVMNAGLGLGTLTHELVHPLVEADFPDAPTWINEGIASVFEAPVIPRAGEIHGVKNWRHPRLARALASRAERDRARLDALFGMSDRAFRGDGEDLHYAMARYACQWLDSRGQLWPFYQRWRDSFSDDPTGERAFAAVVGMAPREAHAGWARWVLSL